MTTTLRPMLVSSGPLPRDSDKYAFEVKWDGFRALVQAAPGSVRILSRTGNEMTFHYPELLRLGNAVSQLVLVDGEIVVLDDRGRSAAKRERPSVGSHAQRAVAWRS
jgi:bifunctional non-homologous end joining protein LigD